MIRQIVSTAHPAMSHLVACPREKPYHDRFRNLVGEPSMVSIPSRRFRWQSQLAIEDLIRSAGVTVIHSHGFGAGLYGRLASARTGRPCVHTFHGMMPGGAAGLVRQLCEAALAPWTAAAVAVSESEAVLARRLGPLSRRLRVIPNGVEFPAEREESSAWLRVLSVGRLERQKDPLALLDIAVKVRDDRICRFRVVGGGPLAQAMRRSVNGLKLGRVELLGTLGSCQDEYRNADVFLSTSLWEGLSLALLEAMSAGLAPVVTRVAGNLDVVEEGVTGFLFEPGDHDRAAALLRMMANSPDVRQRVGDAARRSVRRRFAVADTVRSYQALYLEACA
ncbi:MAG: glycosyltransferase family 4 protein [Acidobacteria bacterium]|nr:glycosyltransferase family 4 protein [Acidobacteriota bacterium]